jgi:hypothetical protein
MKERLVMVVATAMLFACNNENNSQNKTQITPQIIERQNLAQYDFENNLIAPLRIVRDSYFQDPVLSATGLQLLPDAMDLDVDSRIKVNQLTFPTISHNGGLLRIVTHGQSNMYSSDTWSYDYWVHIEHVDANGFKKFGGGMGYGNDFLDYNSGSVDRTDSFFVGNHNETELKTELEFLGNNIETPINAYSLTSIEVQNATLTDSDLTMSGKNALFDDRTDYCGFDFNQLSGNMDLSTTDQISTLTAEIFLSGNSFATLTMDTENGNGVALSGTAQVVHPGFEGTFPADGFMNYTDTIEGDIKLTTCSFPFRFEFNIDDAITESDWTTIYSVDMTDITDLASEQIQAAPSESGAAPELTVANGSIALELLPKGFLPTSKYGDIAKFQTPNITLPENTNAIEVSVDYDVTLVQPEICDSISFEFAAKELVDTLGYYYGRKSIDLEDLPATSGTLTQQMFIPDAMADFQMEYRIETYDCDTNLSDDSAHVTIDNIIINKAVYDQHPLSGTWTVGFFGFGSQCEMSYTKANITLPDSLGDFTVDLDNGLTANGSLSLQGEISVSLTKGSDTFLFEDTVKALDSMTVTSEASCTMIMDLSR